MARQPLITCTSFARDVLTALVPNGEKKRIEFSILADRMRKDASEGAERAALYDRALDLALDTINHREAAFVVTKRYWLNGVEDKATRVLEAMDVRGRAVVQGVAATSHALKQRVARLQKTRAPPIERVAAEAVGSDEVPTRSVRPRRTPGRNRYNNEHFTDLGSTDEEEIVGQDAGEGGAPVVDEDDADEEDDAMEDTGAGGQNVAAAVPSTRRTSHGSYHGCSPDDDTDNPKAISFNMKDPLASVEVLLADKHANRYPGLRLDRRIHAALYVVECKLGLHEKPKSIKRVGQRAATRMSLPGGSMGTLLVAQESTRQERTTTTSGRLNGETCDNLVREDVGALLDKLLTSCSGEAERDKLLLKLFVELRQKLYEQALARGPAQSSTKPTADVLRKEIKAFAAATEDVCESVLLWLETDGVPMPVDKLQLENLRQLLEEHAPNIYEQLQWVATQSQYRRHRGEARVLEVNRRVALATLSIALFRSA